MRGGEGRWMLLSVPKQVLKKLLALCGLRIVRVPRDPPVSEVDPKVDARELALEGHVTRNAGAEFVSSRGEIFRPIDGYRRRIWGTDWQVMQEERATPSSETVRKLQLAEKGRSQVEVLERLLADYGCGIQGWDALEVGCFDGAACYALIEKGAHHVVGIDLARGFVPDVNPRLAEIAEVAKWLDSMRDFVRLQFETDRPGRGYGGVTFRDLDICDLQDVGKYDLVFSTSTFEHLLDYRTAFGRMYAALKPGGMSFHQYHPFFCSSGAHFDTLDFPWGHARLSAEDFRRYIKEFRPDEVDLAEYRFFRTINRMSISDLKNAARSAGFEILELLSTGEDWRTLEPPVFQQSRALYPSLTVEDLIATGVSLLMRKPS